MALHNTSYHKIKLKKRTFCDEFIWIKPHELISSIREAVRFVFVFAPFFINSIFVINLFCARWTRRDLRTNQRQSKKENWKEEKKERKGEREYKQKNKIRERETKNKQKPRHIPKKERNKKRPRAEPYENEFCAIEIKAV